MPFTLRRIACCAIVFLIVLLGNAVAFRVTMDFNKPGNARTWNIREDTSEAQYGSGTWVPGRNSFTSQPPLTVEVQTNGDAGDGYMDYGNQHADFNVNGQCGKTGDSSGLHSVTCTFRS